LSILYFLVHGHHTPPGIGLNACGGDINSFPGISPRTVFYYMHILFYRSLFNLPPFKFMLFTFRARHTGRGLAFIAFGRSLRHQKPYPQKPVQFTPLIFSAGQIDPPPPVAISTYNMRHHSIS